ncbi:alpha/beta hydrolase [Psychrosphaera sp. 1_MG-2023]|uniref:alpha/beta family hydrolase n=1 Tax=Psychrosphaera sp. 1_MG-2023 TaxID=3062643 RepID=UPI0026E15D0C|nr:alpha/beta family hydrolase [Psychrosphaera sp. 1_MG-2023]MDO6718052.1 alpha/beta hydrolase [Psychrosphaera sp. 1_MG-2023]
MIKITTVGEIRRTYIPNDIKAVLVIAHGAGAGLKHEFMDSFCHMMAQYNIAVWSFNFPYMQIMYETEKRRPPNKVDKLVTHYFSEIGEATRQFGADLPLFVAGKSMGGRVSSLVSSMSLAQQTLAELENVNIAGNIVLGYPFIPPGKPEKFESRTQHFKDLQCSSLILQGERDTFGNTAVLNSKTFPDQVTISWIPNGDHSFKPLKSSGKTYEDNLELAAKLSNDFIHKVIGK